MADQHIETKMLPFPEAQERLKAFAAEIEEMVKRYELHNFIYAASISHANAAGQPTGYLAHSESYGCQGHALSFLSRFLSRKIPLSDLIYFVHNLNGLTAERSLKEMFSAIDVPEPPAEQGAPPPGSSMAEADAFMDKVEAEQTAREEGKLLNMPLPKGPKWKN